MMAGGRFTGMKSQTGCEYDRVSIVEPLETTLGTRVKFAREGVLFDGYIVSIFWQKGDHLEWAVDYRGRSLKKGFPDIRNEKEGN